MHTSIRVILAAMACTGMVACKPHVKPGDTQVTETRETTTQPPTGEDRFTVEDLETNPCLRQRVVYFDFDRSEIKPEFQQIMACHGKYLTDRPSAMVTLEGHADERGTREYNLGLGERRGNAVSGALQANGGSAGQLNVVSYGEERPTCTDSEEGCWSRNRRVEIVYTAK
jgi:peptidoglycan-associated lipoprotein